MSRVKLIVLNLTERGKQRWRQIQKDFAPYSDIVSLQRFSGIDLHHQDGCFASHVAALAEHADESLVVIAEDDCVPVTPHWLRFLEVLAWATRTAALDDDSPSTSTALEWDAINFGTSKLEPQANRNSENSVLRPVDGAPDCVYACEPGCIIKCTTLMAYRPRRALPLLQSYVQQPRPWQALDDYLGLHLKCLVVFPMTVFQRSGFSHINPFYYDRHADYDECVQSSRQYLPVAHESIGAVADPLTKEPMIRICSGPEVIITDIFLSWRSGREQIVVLGPHRSKQLAVDPSNIQWWVDGVPAHAVEVTGRAFAYDSVRLESLPTRGDPYEQVYLATLECTSDTSGADSPHRTRSPHRSDGDVRVGVVLNAGQPVTTFVLSRADALARWQTVQGANAASTLQLNDEALLEPWINHHAQHIGVDVYIIYNNSGRVSAELQHLLTIACPRTRVCFIPWAVPYYWRGQLHGQAAQALQQNHALWKYGSVAQLAFIDADEYLVLKDSALLTTQLARPDVCSVSVQTLLFGCARSAAADPAPAAVGTDTTQFWRQMTECASTPEGAQRSEKQVLVPSKTRLMGIHRVHLAETHKIGVHYADPVTEAVLHHYHCALNRHRCKCREWHQRTNTDLVDLYSSSGSGSERVGGRPRSRSRSDAAAEAKKDGATTVDKASQRHTSEAD
jgi:GR25 family glycosyltransferase involved in LPS biosynthesis